MFARFATVPAHLGYNRPWGNDTVLGSKVIISRTNRNVCELLHATKRNENGGRQEIRDDEAESPSEDEVEQLHSPDDEASVSRNSRNAQKTPLLKIPYSQSRVKDRNEIESQAVDEMLGNCIQTKDLSKELHGMKWIDTTTK